jgi:hypothetical protein
MCAGALALAVCAGAAFGQTITQWNFNVSGGGASVGTQTPNIGSGTIVALGTPQIAFRNGAGSTDTSTPDNAALDLSPWQAQGLNSGVSGVEFRVSTAGFSNIVVSWDHRHSNRMSRWVQFQYSTNGGASYSTAGLPNGGLFEASLGGDLWYNNRTVDLSNIPAAANNPNFRFRVVSVFSPVPFVNNNLPFDNGTAYNTSGGNLTPYDVDGRSRLDNVTVRQQNTPTNPAINAEFFPEAVCADGNSSALLTARLTPGVVPTSSGVTVTADLSGLGFSSTEALVDNGTLGDQVAGDGVYSRSVYAEVGIPTAEYTIPITVSDAQNRSSTVTEKLRVSTCAPQSAGAVVISQIFGGGGAFSAPVNADFIELFNRSNSPVNIGGWSVWAAGSSLAATFTTDRRGIIPANTILLPGQHYLVQTLANPGQFGIPLFADVTFTPGFGIDQSDAKVALVRNSTTVPACPIAGNPGPDVEDWVAYGVKNECFLGGSATLSTAVTQSVKRKQGGCQNTWQNFFDFRLASPEPRDSQIGLTPCCPADYDDSGFVDSDDFVAFVNDFERGCRGTGVGNAGLDPNCSRSADYDTSGFVDSDDFVAFVAAFSAGCGV